MSSQVIQILSKVTKEPVDATLLGDILSEELVAVQKEWASERAVIKQSLLTASVPLAKWPQSLHWDWEMKAVQLKLLAVSVFGITCEGQWQGLMMTKAVSFSSRLGSDKGKPLVYIDFLETAPWNWKIDEIGREGRFGAVGWKLVQRAVIQSIDEGFHGRVGLHSLPQAESFYVNLGMTPLGRDTKKQDLLYFELSRQEAMKFL